ncbi:hypothetical protein [Micromonospora chersina]|uniref:hypothetical protein n=1 Tax=Micromonospora chersina TaxID=47854 RepID=UPI003717F033
MIPQWTDRKITGWPERGGRPGATCRCFGRTAAPLGRHHVWRNAFLVGCATAGALAPAGPVRPGEAVLAVAGGLLPVCSS